MPSEQPQNFELIELLIQEATASTSTKQGGIDKPFKARFQSYIDQIPSYLHSVKKPGFFPHFFFGSFSTVLDTEIAEKLGVEKVYFRFDGPKTLKVVVVKDGGITSDVEAINNIKLFSISEDKSGNQFTSGELEDVLKKFVEPAEARNMKDRIHGRVNSKLVQIYKGENGISVEMKNKEILDSATSHKFHEIKKAEEIWKDPQDSAKSKPEDYIAELTGSVAKEVKESLKEFLNRIGNIHSKYKNSLSYAEGAQEAAHHGFVAGVFMNFRYRYNLRVYLEQFAGRGYADIVLLPRGKERSLNSIPIIIELKAGTGRGTTPNDALEQAKDYSKGFQPNTMRVLTTSKDVLCVGLNLDSTTTKFEMYLSPSDEREPALPTIDELLEEASKWNGEKDTARKLNDIGSKIRKPLERIYHTFPGTGEKGGDYFGKFLMGQLLFADKFKKVGLKRFVLSYDEYPLDWKRRSRVQEPTERPVTTFALIRESRNKEIFIFHIREGGKGDRSSKKVPMRSDLPERSKITEVYISLHEKKKSDFFDIEEINRYNSLSEYKEGNELFRGKLKEVPYPSRLREAFDEALRSQLAVGQPLSVDKYSELLKKVGEGIFPFKDFVKKEADFQGVLHGAFSYYSDLELNEPSGALVLTEFQTGRGKRVDMMVHGIIGQGSNAKEYVPIGLELKGPREGKNVVQLKDEANNQITEEYGKGVTYKTLTDGNKVSFIGVVFNKGAGSGNSLIETSKNEFTSVNVVHSSVMQVDQQCFGRSKRSIGMVCVDSHYEETAEEKERRTY